MEAHDCAVPENSDIITIVALNACAASVGNTTPMPREIPEWHDGIVQAHGWRAGEKTPAPRMARWPEAGKTHHYIVGRERKNTRASNGQMA